MIAVSHGVAARRAAPATRRSTRHGVHVVHNGIDTDFYRPDPGDRRARAPRRRPRPADRSSFVGRITRQKGVPHLLRAALRVRPGGADRAARRSRRHAGAGGRDRRRGRRRCAPSATASCWVSEMLPPRGRPPGAHATPRCSCARRSTSRSGSSTSRRWRARRRSSPATSAASRRSSPTVTTGLLVHYDDRRPGGVRGRPGGRRQRARRAIPARAARDGRAPAGSGRSTSSAGTPPPGGRSTSTGHWCAAASPADLRSQPEPVREQRVGSSRRRR